MADNEINVGYDKTDVPSDSPSGSTGGFSNELSAYLYPKLNGIENDDGNGGTDFTQSEISQYGLNIVNNKIDISTTRKLIKYLKTYAKKLYDVLTDRVDDVEDELDTKLNISDYVVDSALNSTSTNPVQNKIIKSKTDSIELALNDKSNNGHTHTINDISSLKTRLELNESNISKKADGTDLTNHINNSKNPHNVTLEQLGFDRVKWTHDTLASQSNHPFADRHKPACTRMGNLCIFSFVADFTRNTSEYATICILKTDFRPDRAVLGVGYLVTTGKSFAYNIGTDGRMYFGRAMNKGDTVRIYDCYFINDWFNRIEKE